MEITGTQIIAASRQEVWDALNDPGILEKCLPGCESVEKTAPDRFTAIMAVAVGPLRARFNGTLHMTDVAAPASCTMVFEGQGGAIGFGKGSSSVELNETPDGTQLSYTATAQIGGKLAQVGSRLIDNVARKMADDFFKAFKKQIAGPAPDDQAAPTREATASPASSPAAAARASEPSGHGSPAIRPALAAQNGALARAASMPEPANRMVMVPGWWLFVAAALGSALTVAGALLLR